MFSPLRIFEFQFSIEGALRHSSLLVPLHHIASLENVEVLFELRLGYRLGRDCWQQTLDKLSLLEGEHELLSLTLSSEYENTPEGNSCRSDSRTLGGS